jgi:hypothetical protein
LLNHNCKRVRYLCFVGEECKGHWVFSASSKQTPEIVDLSMQRILNATEIYSGIYARVSVRFFPYASNGKKGIGYGLGPVQIIEEGEPIGGRVSAATAFGDNSGGYNPVPAQAPAYTKPANYQKQPVQLDPITGAPVNGGVMGL